MGDIDFLLTICRLLMSTKRCEKHEGDIYYDPKVNRFLQLRSKADDYCICGGHTIFYEDAQTDIAEQRLSGDYCEDCIKVEHIDAASPYWERTECGAWKVKGVE